MFLLISGALAAGLRDCPRTFDASQIVASATDAEGAFVRLDAEGFGTSWRAMELRVGCSEDILSGADIARVHRVEALAAFLDERDTQVPLALAGLFASEPGHQIPSSLLPEGHPIRALLPNAMLALRDDEGTVLPAPRAGRIEVDGQRSLFAPTQRAAVLQQIDADGRVLSTHYRWPDETGFVWFVPTAKESQLVVEPAPVAVAPVKTRTGPGPWAHRGPLLGAAAGSVVASGVLYALALNAHSVFEEAPILAADASETRRDEYRAHLEGVQAQANLLSYASYGAAGVGLTLGVVTVITW